MDPFYTKDYHMAFEEEILFPPFQEEVVEGEPDLLEDDELEGDEDDNAKEPDVDEDADDDLGLEEE